MNRFNRTLLSRLAVTAVVIAGLGGAAAPLQAATASVTSGDPPSMTLNTSGMDLHSDAGKQALIRRIRAAARRVCPQTEARDLAHRTLAERCRTEALASALQQVDDRTRLAQRNPSATTH